MSVPTTPQMAFILPPWLEIDSFDETTVIVSGKAYDRKQFEANYGPLESPTKKGGVS